MSDPINEFAINLPMTSVSPVGAGASSIGTPAPPPMPVDITAAQDLPPDVSTDCSHISVYAESCTVAACADSSPNVPFDIVVNVAVTDPNTGVCRTYKVVKRISMDKLKLACDAECMQPVSVVEAEEDQEMVKAEMAAFNAANWARRVAGISESLGTKTFNVSFSYLAEDGKRTTSTKKVKLARDRAHARFMFELKNAPAFADCKITKIEELV